MKKVLVIAIALVVCLGVFAACGGEKAPEVKPYEGTLEDLTAAIYEINSVEFMVGPAMQVDLTDADASASYLGTSAIDNVSEATFSESMMGSQAYSLVLVRAKDTSAVEALKKAMFEGIDTAKWICVEADQLRVVSSGDIVMLVMASTELGEGIADGMVDAFKQTVGELSGETLTRG